MKARAQFVLHWGQACVASLLFVLGGSGCVTSKLYQHTEAGVWVPQPIERAYVLPATNQPPTLGVLFTQQRKSGFSPASRSALWLVSPPPARVVVDPDALSSLTAALRRGRALAIYSDSSVVPSAVTNQPPGYVVKTSSPAGFIVHVNGVPPGPHTLPYTPGKTNTGLRLVVTPFAVGADALIGLSAVASTCADLGLVAPGCH
jgi:hypothetical protein